MNIVLPLEYPRLWFAAGMALVAAIVSGSLAPGEYVGPVMFWHNDKVTHALGYAGLTLWFAGIYPKSRYGLVVAGVFLLGVALEILQGMMSFGRERDFGDLAANTTGIAVGFVLAWVWLGGWAQWIEARIRRLRSR